jgi:hypothetical protein
LSATAADPLIIDLDATLVASHSDKENAAGTYKGGYGFAPFIASCDYGAGNGTGEILACLLRPGNAGANSADDHISVFETAVSGLPEGFFDETGTLAGENVLVRTDSAGASRKFLWYLHGQNAQFSVSYPVPAAKAHMVDWINDKKNWQPALDQGGHERTDAWVINATDIIPLTNYPPGTNLFLRAEPLHPGAQPTLLDIDGHRITAFLTNSPRWHGPFLDARHRARARCENRIKTLKTPAWASRRSSTSPRTRPGRTSRRWPSIWSPGSSSPHFPAVTTPRDGTSNAGATGSSPLQARSSPAPERAISSCPGRHPNTS